MDVNMIKFLNLLAFALEEVSYTIGKNITEATFLVDYSFGYPRNDEWFVMTPGDYGLTPWCCMVDLSM